MAHSVDVRTIERLGETRWGHGVVCFRVTALGSSPVLRCFRNAGPRIPCNLVTVEHQRPEKRPAGRGGRRPRKNDPRRQRALICTAWCVEEAAGAGGRGVAGAQLKDAPQLCFLSPR